MNKIYVTGDTHTEWVRRLNGKNFPEGKGLTEEDYIIICGDLGTIILIKHFPKKKPHVGFLLLCKSVLQAWTKVVEYVYI